MDGSAFSLELLDLRYIVWWLRRFTACYSLFRSPALTQFMIITDGPETRMNPGCDLLNAQEANREQREEKGESNAGIRVDRVVTLKREFPEPAPALALRAKKAQPIRVGL